MVTPVLRLHHLTMLMLMLVIMMQCYLIYLAKGTFQTKDQALRYSFIPKWGLILVQKIKMSSYLYVMNHSMVENAIHMQMSVVIKSQKMMMV